MCDVKMYVSGYMYDMYGVVLWMTGGFVPGCNKMGRKKEGGVRREWWD